MVLAMACTTVKPPIAAARDPVRTVSLCSKPGSRRWVWRSTSPGSASNPVASIWRAPAALSPAPSSATTPPSMRMSVVVPSARVAPAMSVLVMSVLHRASQKQIEHCHPYRHPVGDLFPHCREAGIGSSRGNFEAAIHRPGVHDNRIRAQAGKARVVEPPAPGILARVGEERRVHPFCLNAQHHDDVGLGGEGVVKVEVEFYRPFSRTHRQERWRSYQPHRRTEGGQQPDV